MIDLYAIEFDPVFQDRDVVSYTAADIPEDVLKLIDLRARAMDPCRGLSSAGSRPGHGKSQSDIAALIRDHVPKDVLAQQEKIAWADGLAFIAPSSAAT